MKRLLGVFLTLAVLSGIAAAESGPSAWRHLAPVETGGVTGYLNVAVGPDSLLWEKGTTDLNDLRMVDDQGQMVPYLFWHPHPQEITKELSGSLINVGRDEARKQSAATLDLGESPPVIDRIQAVVGLQGRYLLAVQVEGSHDQKEWLQLPTTDLLYDLTAQGGDRNDLIRLAGPVQMRYIRIRVPDVGDRPAPVQAITVSAVAKEAPLQEPAFAGKPVVSRDAARKVSMMTLDLAARRRVDAVELVTPSHGFFRHVTVEGSSDQQSWQRLGGGMIYSYEANGQRRVSTTLPISGCQCRYLRLVVEDGDDAPLADPTLRVTGVPARIFFEAQPGRRYSVLVGNAGAQRPVYDLARMPVQTDTAPVVALGALVPNPTYEAEQPPLSDRFPWLLPTVLALLVLIVGAGAVQMARRIHARESQAASETEKTTPD